MSEEEPTAEGRVDIGRIKKQVLDLAAIGKSENDHGIYRMAFTEADMEGKRWLLERIGEAGLTADSDGASNIFGKLVPPGEAGRAPSVIMGSHIDTVPCAGALDGALGVVVALECLRVIREEGNELKRPLELVAFSDEEGRFGGMFGSQAFCGEISPNTLHQTDLDGVTLEAAMRARGLDPLKALDAARRRESVASYLELHIEQGPVLERKRMQVGIVENITGLFKWLVRFHGEANHAGTTPMDMRNDAFMGLADFAHEIPRIIDENGSERSRVTVGRAQILPGSANTVPGLVEFSLDARDTDPAVLEELGRAVRRTLSAIARRRGLQFDYDAVSHIEPVACDPALVETLAAEADGLGLKALRMPSGAAHDAQILGKMTRMGMLFAPSKGGRSHSPEEWTPWDDVEAAANLSLQTLRRLATAEAGG